MELCQYADLLAYLMLPHYYRGSPVSYSDESVPVCCFHHLNPSFMEVPSVLMSSHLNIPLLSILLAVSYFSSLAPGFLPESRACDVGFLDVGLFVGSFTYEK